MTIEGKQEGIEQDQSVILQQEDRLEEQSDQHKEETTTTVKEVEPPKPLPTWFQNINNQNITFLPLDSYSWCEEEWKVKIFVDFPEALKLTDDQILLVRVPFLAYLPS